MLIMSLHAFDQAHLPHADQIADAHSRSLLVKRIQYDSKTMMAPSRSLLVKTNPVCLDDHDGATCSLLTGPLLVKHNYSMQLGITDVHQETMRSLLVKYNFSKRYASIDAHHGPTRS